ncbi:hypothetical protein [Acidithiobacillus sulfuriphilus]|uniref:Uncharacterized protein n=2 Tax=Acidithiobacillus sulfuriphilus TaxID=1867749 RepID=A0A3M8QNH1_9PROT|nr:hypothetical protein [Acidithiobacillus sulfuriphilus]RNF57809.1 hypothetical protein EC580_14400 [Acidithiobacillus sulfuriphilus]
MKVHNYRTKTARMLRECFHLEMDLFACQMREYKDRRKDSPFHQIRGRMSEVARDAVAQAMGPS